MDEEMLNKLMEAGHKAKGYRPEYCSMSLPKKKGRRSIGEKVEKSRSILHKYFIQYQPRAKSRITRASKPYFQEKPPRQKVVREKEAPTVQQTKKSALKEFSFKGIPQRPRSRNSVTSKTRPAKDIYRPCSRASMDLGNSRPKSQLSNEEDYKKIKDILLEFQGVDASQQGSADYSIYQIHNKNTEAGLEIFQSVKTMLQFRRESAELSFQQLELLPVKKRYPFNKRKRANTPDLCKWRSNGSIDYTYDSPRLIQAYLPRLDTPF